MAAEEALLKSPLTSKRATMTSRPGCAFGPVHHGTRHPKPYTLHPKPYTLHPKPYTLHPKPYTLNPKPYTLHPQPQTLHPKPCRASAPRRG